VLASHQLDDLVELMGCQSPSADRLGEEVSGPVAGCGELQEEPQLLCARRAGDIFLVRSLERFECAHAPLKLY